MVERANPILLISQQCRSLAVSRMASAFVVTNPATQNG
jgi:hypothetical protein